MRKIFLAMLLAIATMVGAHANEGVEAFRTVDFASVSADDVKAAQKRVNTFFRAPQKAAGDQSITSRDEVLGDWVMYYNSPVTNLYGSFQNLWSNHIIISASSEDDNTVYIQNIMNEHNLIVKGTVDVASGYIDIEIGQMVGYDGSAPVYLFSYNWDFKTPLQNVVPATSGTISLELHRNSYDDKLEFITESSMAFFAYYQENYYPFDMIFFITGKQPNAVLSYMHSETAGIPTESDFKQISYNVDVVPGYDENDPTLVTAMMVSSFTSNSMGIPVIFQLEAPNIGKAVNEVGDYIYSSSYTQSSNGYYIMSSLLSSNSATAEVQGSFNDDRTEFQFNPEYNWMLYDWSLGNYEGENKPATITLNQAFPEIRDADQPVEAVIEVRKVQFGNATTDGTDKTAPAIMDRESACASVTFDCTAGQWDGNVYCKISEASDGNADILTSAQPLSLSQGESQTIEFNFDLGEFKDETVYQLEVMAQEAETPLSGKYYFGIKAKDGIQSVESDNVERTVYNLQGIKVQNPNRGVYIIGNQKKVIK